MRRCDCDSLKPKTMTGRMVQTIRGAGGGGTLVHGELTGRDAKDQHPISAITGLTEALARSTGVTFTPHISLDGVISWTNDGGLANPAPVSVKGAKGDKGETGATGATGVQGEQGEKGDKGDAGEPGKAATIAVGAVETGEPGTEVSVTNTGTENAAVLRFVIPRGEKGEQGERGLQGERGERGETGAKGETGAQGEPGKDGTSFKVLGLYASLSALQAAHPTGTSGDAWAVGTSEANSIYLWDAEKAQWENIGSIKGQKGEKGDKGDPGERGEQGIQGEAGATGAQGEQGIQGIPGEKGADGVSPTVTVGAITGGHKVSITDVGGTQSFDVLNGAKGEQGVAGEAGARGEPGERGADGAKGDPGEAATITIGSVTSGAEASVENAGTANAAVLNFVLPKGDKGEKGDTGLQGAAGEPGAKGDTGEAGKNGTDGKNGEDGFSPTIAVETVENGTKVTITDKTGDKTFTVKNGEKGAQGVQGERGEQGIQGVQGEQGVQGIQGETGATGEKGADGFSPIVTVVKKGTVTTVTMTDASGATSAEILDGAKGDKGDAGYTPVKGIDYWTSTDITDIENDLKAWTNGQGFLTEHQSLAGYATETWVEGKGYQTAEEVSAAIESAKEQLFIVTITPNGEPTEDEDSITYSCTPSVTFEEAVAQVKSGKKVVIGAGGSDKYVRLHYESSPNLLLSDYEFNLSHDENIKNFHPFILQHFQWSRGGFVLIVYKTLPKWIGDTKPTYSASEVGADASGAAAQALTDAKTWAETELAEKENKALYITMEEGTYDSSTGHTPVTFSESYETVLAALQAGKRVFTHDALGNPGELYLTDAMVDTIVGRINYFDTIDGRGIFWSGEQDGYMEDFLVAKPPKRVSVILTASGWDSSAKTQTVTVNGVLADESAQVIQPIPAIASQSAYNAAGILATGQAANSITFTASTVPTADLSVYIVITEVTA